MKRKTATKTIRRISILLAAALVFTCTSVPKVDFAGLGKAGDFIPLTNRALTGILPNGLRYYILENSRPENRAHAVLVVNAGSVLEKDDERGYSHFVEHLAFSDTERFPNMGHIEYLRTLGMRFGPDINGYASYNETVFYFDVPVETINGIKMIPERALSILDDWTHAININPENVEKDRLIILEELRSRSDINERYWNFLLPILFSGSLYQNRQPIGLIETIQAASIESLKNYYNRWYTSDNMAVIFIGDFDGKALERDLTRHFNMSAPEKPVNRPRYELPPPKKGNFQIEVFTDPEFTATEFNIYYKMNYSAQKGTLGYYRETLINSLIYNMLSRRFDEAANNPQSAASGSAGYIFRWAEKSQFYYLGTQAKTGSTEAALRELLLEKESIRRYGFTDTELERAKLNLISSIERQLSEKDQQNSRSFSRGFTSHFLAGDAMPDIEWEMNAVRLLLPGIGTREISAAVKNYFASDDTVVLLAAPEAEAGNLPSKERIRAIFDETARARIEARKPDVLSGDLLERQPLPGEIIREIIDNETGAIILTLNNGVNVILKETDNRNNEIIMYAAAKGGIINAPENEAFSASLASEMISVSGLGPYSRTELINMLAGKQVSMSFSASIFTRSLQGSSTVNDIKTLFEMLHLFFTNPRFDDGAIQAMMDQYRTNLVYQDENPQNYFAREVNSLIYNNNPHFKSMELDDLDKISKEHAINFILNCINPGDYSFVFTGNININEIKQLAAIYLGSIPASKPMNSWINPEIRWPVNTEKTLFKGQDDRCLVYLSWFAKGHQGFDEKINYTATLLTDYLRIVLNDEIRENQSGVYGISSSATVTFYPDNVYMMNVYFICDPQRSVELIASVKDVITDIARNGVNADIFYMATEAQIRSHESSLQRNLHIAESYINSFALYNTPLSRLHDRPNVIRSIRPEEIQTFCRTLLSSGPLQIVMYPENMK